MYELSNSEFQPLSNEEMLTVDGGIGIILACVLVGGACTVAGFGIGYAIAWWLG